MKRVRVYPWLLLAYLIPKMPIRLVRGLLLYLCEALCAWLISRGAYLSKSRCELLPTSLHHSSLDVRGCLILTRGARLFDGDFPFTSEAACLCRPCATWLI